MRKIDLWLKIILNSKKYFLNDFRELPAKREAGVQPRGTIRPQRNATSALGLPVTKAQSTYEKMLRVPVNSQRNGDAQGT